MAAEEERSVEARRLAEEALISLQDALGTSPVRLIVVGGLVPQTLAGGDRPPHVGTTDIDILIAVHVSDVEDAAPVEQALERVGAFRDPATADGWRWRIPVGRVGVKIEFLCDDSTFPNKEAIRLPGCRMLAALNLRGTGYVARDYHSRQITIGDRTVTVLFSGLEGYLLAKAHAARGRGADKDYYDFAYVLLHNRAGGPLAAAAQLQNGVFAAEVPALRSIWLEIDARFHGPSSGGAQAYARQALLVDPNASEPALRNDSYAAVAEFIRELGIA